MSLSSSSGRVVVITGASSGIGKHVALQLAKTGASIVLAARQQDKLEAVASACVQQGGHALVVPTDVSQPDDVEQLAQKAIAAFGRIDVWINNAGVGAVGAFHDVPLADHDKVLRTNLLGTVYGSYTAMKRFRAQGSGTLINVASMLGRIPAPYNAAYNASKSGVIGLSTTLREELKQDGLDSIHVCTVLPMALDTPFFDHAANYTGHKAVPIPPTYPVQTAVDAIVGVLDTPENEVVAGKLGVLAGLAHAVTPGVIERVISKEVAYVQMEKPPAAPHTTGTLYTPKTGTA